MSKEFWKPGNMIYPLPAVMVSCQEKDSKPNIITIAWTGTICTNPPMVYISVRPERYSYDIIKNTGEFVINITTKELVKAVDYCGVRSGRNIDKFKEMRLTPVSGEMIAAPYIKECPVNIECSVESIVELGSHHMFIAKVKGVHVDTEYLNEKGKLELSRANPIVYVHGEYYGLGDILGNFGYSVRKSPPPKKSLYNINEDKVQKTDNDRVQKTNKYSGKKTDKGNVQMVDKDKGNKKKKKMYKAKKQHR